jgi:hypothetical protein
MNAEHLSPARVDAGSLMNDKYGPDEATARCVRQEKSHKVSTHLEIPCPARGCFPALYASGKRQRWIGIPGLHERPFNIGAHRPNVRQRRVFRSCQPGNFTPGAPGVNKPAGIFVKLP